MERKTEFILTLIGAITSAIASGFMVLMTFLMALGATTINDYSTSGGDYYYDTYSSSDLTSSDASILVGVMIFFTAICVIFAVVGFIAAFQIKKNSTGWGIAVFVMGIISFASIRGILWIIAGIMMMARKAPSPVAGYQDEKSASDTLTDDMEKLKDLRDQGIITEEEYEAKKNEWLDF